MNAQSVPEGWVTRPTREFGTMVGPFYEPADRDPHQCGFLAEGKHGNKRGFVHGGMIATAFDAALGTAAWASANQQPSVTVQLNIHYVGALSIGQFARIQTDIVRTTRSLVFLRGIMQVADRTIAVADGIWKILHDSRTGSKAELHRG